jgi:hypothetical protein
MRGVGAVRVAQCVFIRKGKATSTGEEAMNIPIVDRNRSLVGWTAVAPVVADNRLRHPEAERLLRGPVICIEIALTDPAHVARAGAPRGWRSAWRCMALCCDEPIAEKRQLAQFLASAPDADTKTPPARRRRRSGSQRAMGNRAQLN